MISNRIVTCSIYYRETLKQIKQIKKKSEFNNLYSGDSYLKSLKFKKDLNNKTKKSVKN
jgi:hypothetical protein|tara:strand:+ start:219 stop:395 length:177 start_codon:yes stop_codon:yes gene_type:complete